MEPSQVFSGMRSNGVLNVFKGEIKKEYDLLHKLPKRILVLGLPKTGKSSLIDAILTANHMFHQQPTPSVDQAPTVNNNPDSEAPIPIPQTIPPLPTTILGNNWHIQARNLRDDMIQSQYETGGMIVTEWTEPEAKHTAVSNLKYFPVLKDEFTADEKKKIKRALRWKSEGRKWEIDQEFQQWYDSFDFVNFPIVIFEFPSSANDKE